jgi:tetratricopeptide (TPR) repeat protein
MSRTSIRAPAAARHHKGTSAPARFRIALVAFVLAISGCAAVDRGEENDDPAATAVGPDPAVVAAHDEAVALVQAGDDTQAATRLDALVTQYPQYAGPMVNRALIHARRGETDSALALLERAVAVCEHCAEAWNQRGVLLRQNGRFSDAEEAYHKAIAANPQHAPVHFNLGVLYDLYLQRPELALEQYESYVALETDASVAADVNKWITDLRRRTGAVEQAASTEDDTP